MNVDKNTIREISLLPTGIGSLPHTDANTACEHILNIFPEIPFWPQLPAIGFNENMYVQFAYDLPGVIIDYKKKKIVIDKEEKLLMEIDDTYRYLSNEKYINRDIIQEYRKEFFHGLYAMVTKLKSVKNVNIVKGQIIGPVSLGLQIVDNTDRPMIYDEFYMDLLVKILNRKAQLQVKYLQEITDKIILFFDEPSLCLIGTPHLNIDRKTIYNMFIELFKSIDAVIGIHCCGNTDWSLIFDLPIDIVSFDAYNYGKNLVLYTDKIIDYINRGGILAFGIVPSVEDIFVSLNKKKIFSLLQELISQFVQKGIPEKQLINSMIIMPSCGLAGMSVKNAIKAMMITSEISKMMKNLSLTLI